MKLVKMSSLMIVSLASIFFTCAQAAVTMPAPKSTAQSMNRVVAVVNSQVILSSDLDQAMTQATAHARAAHMQLPNAKTFRTIILNQLIARALQLQIAQNNKMTVSNKQIDTALANMAKQQGITESGLMSNAKQMGYTTASFRDEVSKEIMMNQLQVQAVGRSVTVSKSEVNALRQQIMVNQKSTLEYNMLDFLVALPDQPTSSQVKSAQLLAQSISQKMQQGSNKTDFQGAQLVSSGWQSVSNIPQAFVNKLQTMKTNQVSIPVRVANGFHVIKFIGKRGKGAPIPSDERVKQIIYQQKMAKAVQKWIDTIRDQAYVKIM